jgi:hypothetical protein
MLHRLLLPFLLIVSVLSQIQAQTSLIPISGADGEFTVTSINGTQVFQSNGSAGNYQPYIYLRSSENVQNQTVYVELTMMDIGYGMVGMEYNSSNQEYQNINGKNAFLLDQNGTKTMVFELKNASFRRAQNLGADLRIYTQTSIQKHLIKAVLYKQPPSIWKEYDENFFGIYTGRKYQGTDKINATTIDGKIICGYQGWFRCPGDLSNNGWVHHFRDQSLEKPTIEFWPDMSEYTADEKYPVPGWTLKDGQPATLFSSANKRTVLRHFQWMQAYGLHCAAVQRFVAGLYPDQPHEIYRIPAYAREAANRTGRAYYIMYDMTGMNPDDIVTIMARDWHILIDSMHITKDDRYLHHGGKPIVGVYGYFPNRFSEQIAHQIAEIFNKPGYEAHIIASGERVDDANPSWNSIYSDFLVYFPWNVGNYTSSDLDRAFAQTQQWQDEKSILNEYGSRFVPLVFPGFAWDNLMTKPPGTTKFGRRKGEVLWTQINDVVNIGAKTVFLAMFDEMDEGTSVFKITNNIPVNHYFSDNEGLSSDFYLNLTGYASSILAGEKTLPATQPDFEAMSQPSIPDIIYPKHQDTVSNLNPTLLWANAIHKSGIQAYQVKLDGQIFSTNLNTTWPTTLQKGWHTFSIRARNNLGNFGGWSEANDFYITGSSAVDESQVKPEIHIFPNPSAGLVHLYSESLAPDKYELFDMTGNLLASGILLNDKLTTLDFSEHIHSTHLGMLKLTDAHSRYVVKKLTFIY